MEVSTVISKNICLLCVEQYWLYADQSLLKRQNIPSQSSQIGIVPDNIHTSPHKNSIGEIQQAESDQQNQYIQVTKQIQAQGPDTSKENG